MARPLKRRGFPAPAVRPRECAKSLVDCAILRHCFKLDQKAPVATVDELADYDAIIFGTPTRFGNMAGQMKNFIDQAGALWMRGALVGKVAGVFTSSATQHGGQESTIVTFHPVLLHLGFLIVGLPYAFQGQMGHAEVMGNSPYGASTIAGGDGSRRPSEIDLEGARYPCLDDARR